MTEPDAHPEADPRIATIAAAIIKAYGDDALAMAERQRDEADVATRADWIAVVEQLRAHRPPRSGE